MWPCLLPVSKSTVSSLRVPLAAYNAPVSEYNFPNPYARHIFRAQVSEYNSQFSTTTCHFPNTTATFVCTALPRQRHCHWILSLGRYSACPRPRMPLSSAVPICPWQLASLGAKRSHTCFTTFHLSKKCNGTLEKYDLRAKVPLAERLEKELDIPIIAINVA